MTPAPVSAPLNADTIPDQWRTWFNAMSTIAVDMDKAATINELMVTKIGKITFVSFDGTLRNTSVILPRAVSYPCDITVFVDGLPQYIKLATGATGFVAPSASISFNFWYR